MTLYHRGRRDLPRVNSREHSLRVFLSALCGKIFLIVAIIFIVSSCSRKRAPSKGCDCPGGRGMLEEKNTIEASAAIYLKSGSKLT